MLQSLAAPVQSSRFKRIFFLVSECVFINIGSMATAYNFIAWLYPPAALVGGAAWILNMCLSGVITAIFAMWSGSIIAKNFTQRAELQNITTELESKITSLEKKANTISTSSQSYHHKAEVLNKNIGLLKERCQALLHVPAKQPFKMFHLAMPRDNNLISEMKVNQDVTAENFHKKLMKSKILKAALIFIMGAGAFAGVYSTVNLVAFTGTANATAQGWSWITCLASGGVGFFTLASLAYIRIRESVKDNKRIGPIIADLKSRLDAIKETISNLLRQQTNIKHLRTEVITLLKTYELRKREVMRRLGITEEKEHVTDELMGTDDYLYQKGQNTKLSPKKPTRCDGCHQYKKKGSWFFEYLLIGFNMALSLYAGLDFSFTLFTDNSDILHYLKIVNVIVTVPMTYLMTKVAFSLNTSFSERPMMVKKIGDDSEQADELSADLAGITCSSKNQSEFLTMLEDIVSQISNRITVLEDAVAQENHSLRVDPITPRRMTLARQATTLTLGAGTKSKSALKEAPAGKSCCTRLFVCLCRCGTTDPARTPILARASINQ